MSSFLAYIFLLDMQSIFKHQYMTVLLQTEDICQDNENIFNKKPPHWGGYRRC